MGRTQAGALVWTRLHGHYTLLEARTASCKTHIPFPSASVLPLPHPAHSHAACRAAKVAAGEAPPRGGGGGAIPRALMELSGPLT